MKRTFLFASIIAMVAVLAVSCKEKNAAGDAPKARFAYATDGLVVTFTNASKDATEYAWDFGDGAEISKEENPVHTYAAAGTYSVKLTAKNAAGENSATESVTVEAKAFEIAIDGNFSDWNDLPADKLAEASLDDMGTMEGLHNIKFIANADYIYFYMEYEGDGSVGVLDIFMNIDGDAATGHDSWLWENSGADILFEGGTDETNWYPDFFTFLNGDDNSGWNWEQQDAEGAINLSEIKAVNNGHLALEGSIVRAAIQGMTSCSVGCLVQGPNWSGEVGALPETYVDLESGASVVPPMITVKLD